jgi:large subunit ribosomal protein L6e
VVCPSFDVQVDDKFDDAYFKRSATKAGKGTEAAFFKDKPFVSKRRYRQQAHPVVRREPTEADKEKKSAKAADQCVSVLCSLIRLTPGRRKSIDASILASIKKTTNLGSYLSSSFALSKGQFPHLMKF